MKTKQKPKGPWIHRFAIHFFTIILAVLVFWVLGFLVEDIESIKGPEYGDIEKNYVSRQFLRERDDLNAEIGEIEQNIQNKRDEMRIVRDSSENLQKTINQLIELQKLSAQKSILLPKAEQANLSDSLSHFLENQKQYQKYNTQLAQLTGQQQKLEAEKRKLAGEITEQQKKAEREYNKLSEKHALRLAFLQLSVLIPLMLAGLFFLIKKRTSIYFPLLLGYSIATFLKVSLVIHEYFPSRYFKYILIFVLLVIVIKLLVHFIRASAFPKTQWLLKQYREAYERFLCPACEYPIRTGPRKFLFWSRRTVSKIIPPAEAAEDENYACPACGTKLFEECPECHDIRHSLLPHCQHCNAEKEI